MKILCFCIMCTLLSLSTNAQQQEKQERMKTFNLTDEGVALQGYDPLSYFQSDEQAKGEEEINYTYQGVTYYFANEANKAEFQKDPAKYEPAYGGWCAYAMGDDGSKVKIDPETYKIIDGKLYLFYHTFWSNTLPKWNKKEGKLKPKAEQNWDTLLTKNK